MANEKIDDKTFDFYQKLRRRIRSWAEAESRHSSRWTEWILIAPDLFHLLTRLMADPDVPLEHKGKVAAAVAYFISPLDLLAELFLGPAGFIDDIVLTAYALNSIVNKIDPQIVVRHWAGKGDILVLIQQILNIADQMLGSGLFGRLKRVLK